MLPISAYVVVGKSIRWSPGLYDESAGRGPLPLFHGRRSRLPPSLFPSQDSDAEAMRQLQAADRVNRRPGGRGDLARSSALPPAVLDEQAAPRRDRVLESHAPGPCG